MIYENTLWIETGKVGAAPDLGVSAPTDATPGYPWQALFACQICLRSYEDWIEFKWGFNAAALLQEAADRQRLFIESLHPGDHLLQQDWMGKRTLALRCIRDPEFPGLRLGLIGKVCSNSMEQAEQAAWVFWKEIQACFPYDYLLFPASEREEFLNLTGVDLLSRSRNFDDIVQIRRFENPLNLVDDTLFVVGRWRSSERGDEQIWRALAGSSLPIVYNVLLRPTYLLERDRAILTKMLQKATAVAGDETLLALQPYASWSKMAIQSWIAPWIRPYIVHISLAAPSGVPEYMARAVGTALTRPGSSDTAAPAFQAVKPVSELEAQQWCSFLYWLECPPGNRFNLADYERLKDLVDLEEAYAVFRFPFPPAPGLPGVSFLSSP